MPADRDIERSREVESTAPPRSDLYFRRLLDTLPSAAYTCDANGVITCYNDEAVRVWGRAPAVDDPAERYCGSFRLCDVEGATVDRSNCCVALALHDQTPHHGEEVVIERPDGEHKRVRINATPIHDEEGRLLGAVNVIVDVTEGKRAESELQESVARRTSELEDLNEELQSFNYSVSHDLRAPLRAISGFSQALLEEYGEVLDEGARHYLSRIDNGSARMSHLIDSLLHLSRLMSVDVDLQMLRLDELVDEIVNEIREQEPERRVEVIVTANVELRADRELLRVLLSNLLGNAWKFTRENDMAHIEVGVERQGSDTVYFVKDDGVGFDMSYSNKLFQAFQRLHPVDRFNGTGIGLATVRRIVKRHGGSVWAVGEPDKGATFYFTLAQS